MRALLRMLISILFVCSFASTSQAERINIGDIKVNATKVNNVRELVKQSALIVYGTFDLETQKYPTKDKVAQGKLVNYVQSFKVSRSLKGSAPATVQILTTGVEPYPKPSDPINKLYSGPFEAGEYILFLRSISNTSFYSIVGIWQGVYPVLGAGSIALEGTGFPELNGLSVEQFAKKIGSMQ